MIIACAVISARQQPLATLTALAILPAETFAAGPPSGAWLRADALGVAQFASQPVQGVSALWPAGGDEWFALSDNGFGARMNSSDYLLRIYRLAVEWGSAARGGQVALRSFTQLADPDRKLPFPIVREATADRWLTGADLDPESMVRMADGTFWIGDEFGPFLLHVAADGRILAPPYEIPGMRSPDHPHLAPADAGQASAATVRRSRGFEGLALFGNELYAVIEAGTGATANAAVIFEFDLSTRAFTGSSWRFALTSADHAVTDFVALAPVSPACGSRFLAIERDGGHGSAARLKRVHEIQLAGGALTSLVVADLLDIANPQRIAGHPERFTFPFITTEAVWPTARDEIVLANDNNFPAGGGRPGAVHDATEFIRLQLSRPLCAG
ncbi:MAG TPA: esterase-like activity of phytase family protein [Vicinamibacterales bacterium]|nr:esterase-like activity of phytase family protein [Vicinamibacterales bacterium]